MSTGRLVRLLDVNVLVALAWPNHVHHGVATEWFEAQEFGGLDSGAQESGAPLCGRWATTPFTESGFVRVSSNRSAIPTASTPDLAIEVLEAMTKLPGHAFWADDVPLVVGIRANGAGPDGESGRAIDPTTIRTHRDVTDAHLVALALRHGGVLSTLDKEIANRLGHESAAAVEVITVTT